MTKDAGDVFDQITKLVDSNGSITQPTKDRLILMAVSGIKESVDDVLDAVNVMTTRQNVLEECQESSTKALTSRIERLERTSIVLWASAHPGLAKWIVVVLIIIAYLDIPRLVLSLLGYPNLLP